MSSSISSRSRVSKQKSRQSNSKHEVKSEVDQEKPKASSVREMLQKSKQRSSSLSKQDKTKLKESPQKSQSVDRSMTNRYGSQNISIKKSLVDTRKSNTGSKKPTLSTNITRNQNAYKATDVKKTPSKQAVKGLEKSSRSPMKGPSGKTSIEIAKSFVRNARDTKKENSSKKGSSRNNTSKSSTSKNVSEKIKSSQSSKEAEDTERPRTSTIHKGPPEINNILTESNEDKTDVQKGLEHSEFGTNASDDKSTADDDDKLSYEEDFEEYDSDFEDSETDPVSETNSSETTSDDEEIVLDSGINKTSLENSSAFSSSEKILDSKKDHPKASKNKEKTFLQMSDRSSLSSKKTSDSSTENKIIKPSHSFINFASAVEEEEKKKYSNKVLKRATDLLEIITLSEETYNHIDIPPMKYDTYIRVFGKTDTKQVFVQTENFEDEEIQTDETEMINKWTQNPSNDNFGSGGDILDESSKEADIIKSLFNTQNVKLSSFLQNCSKVMLTVLNEDYSVSNQIQATQRRNELFYSDGFYTLKPPNFLKDVPILNVYCSSTFSNYVLTIHDGIIKVPHTNDERGVICIWDFLDCQKPEHILVAHNQPTCAAFGPSGSNIVIAGMIDGAVLLWDLSDNSQVGLNDQFSLKSPTYSTAVILGKENHHSCVVAIQALLNNSNMDSSLNFARPNASKNFHVLTLEDMGVINIWVVVEVLKPDFSGLETDLGLSPGGTLRLVRSSSIFLYDLSALQEVQKVNIRTFDFRLIPFDSNRIIVTTDAGIVLHVNRQGGSAEPRFYSSDLEFSSEVRCIDCSPHTEELFLVGCSDGSAKLYNLKLVRPVKVFLQAAKGDPVTLIQWSPIHPAMFVVLSDTSNLYLWNLLEDSLHPINSYHFSDSKVSWFSFCNVTEVSSSHKSSQKLLHMFVSREDGETEVHIFRHEVTEKEFSKQLEYMRNL